MSSYQSKPAIAYNKAVAATRARIARAFGRSAGSYDAHADLQRSVADQLLQKLPPLVADPSILDVGCGTGYCIRLLRERVPAGTVVALDVAEGMLHRARAVPAVVSVCADAQALPLQAGCIDLLVSNLTMQWCSELGVLFAELQRVLRPGGYALLSTLGPACLHELREAWRGIDEKPHANEFVSEPQLLQQARSAGFTVRFERELRVRHYESLRALAQELKGLGANAVLHSGRAGVSPAAVRLAEAAFARGKVAAGIPVQWEVFYLSLQRSS